jgi:divalent metal cation (Fe/Co/Zn/Cd) transporter
MKRGRRREKRFFPYGVSRVELLVGLIVSTKASSCLWWWWWSGRELIWAERTSSSDAWLAGVEDARMQLREALEADGCFDR